MDSFNNKPSTIAFLSLTNVWFTFIFLFEMIVKICGLGCKGYARDAYNLFDGILVTISVFDWVLDTFNLFPLNTSVITVFRSLRVLKIVKLATKNEDL